jgi:hypothetical protein
MRTTPPPRQELDAEISEAWREWGAEKDELLAALRRLDQQGALKDAVAEAFIPPVGSRARRSGWAAQPSAHTAAASGGARFLPASHKDTTLPFSRPQEEVQKVLRRAQWDEDSESWVLERLGDDAPGAPPDAPDAPPSAAAAAPGDGRPFGRRPVAAASAARPVSALARAAAAGGDMNPRFRTENILAMELDLPERATVDWCARGASLGGAGAARCRGRSSCGAARASLPTRRLRALAPRRPRPVPAPGTRARRWTRACRQRWTPCCGGTPTPSSSSRPEAAPPARARCTSARRRRRRPARTAAPRRSRALGRGRSGRRQRPKAGGRARCARGCGASAGRRAAGSLSRPPAAGGALVAPLIASTQRGPGARRPAQRGPPRI